MSKSWMMYVNLTQTWFSNFVKEVRVNQSPVVCIALCKPDKGRSRTRVRASRSRIWASFCLERACQCGWLVRAKMEQDTMRQGLLPLCTLELFVIRTSCEAAAEMTKTHIGFGQNSSGKKTMHTITLDDTIHICTNIKNILLTFG